MFISEFPVFVDSRARLSTKLQDTVDRAIEKFRLTPELAGFSDEKLRNGSGWRSLRVNVDARIIYWRSGEHVYLAYVDHHEAAYRWAESHHLQNFAGSGKPTLVACETRTEIRLDVNYIQNDQTLLFSHLRPEYLLSVGVPEHLLTHVHSAVTDANFDELIGQVNESVWTNLDDVRCGKTPRCFAHNAVQEVQDVRPWVPAEQRALRQALDGGFDRWTLFLHPDQADIIARTFSGPARVFGSAGSGKSVVGLYRAARLARVAESTLVLCTAHTPNIIAKLKRDLDLLLSAEPEIRSRISVKTLKDVALALWRDRIGIEPTIASTII